MKLHVAPLYFRNFIFGVEDGLVSTVGLLSGVAAAGVERETIVLTGVVLILVEGLSMGAGVFLSESSAQEYAHSSEAVPQSLWASTIMFFSYFAAGFVPLFPYIFFPAPLAFQLSIGFSLLALFALGAFSGKLSHRTMFKTALRMALIGGAAIAAGVGAGMLLS